MTQRAAGAWWDCDVPGCGVSDLGQLDELPFGWGTLADADGEEMDICAKCMNLIKGAFNERND